MASDNEEKKDKAAEPESGWSTQTKEIRVYRDPETDDVTKIEVEGQVFVMPTDE